jgi:hypothetical protein
MDSADLTLEQERKVIILAATRSDEESHPENGLGFLFNRHRTNGQSSTYMLFLMAMNVFVSGDHAGAGVAYCDRGPGGTGEG